MDKPLYAVVSYDDTNEVDFVPLNWIVDRSTLADLQAAIDNRRTVKFYWPPWRSPSSVSRAKKQNLDADCSWPTYDARILSTARFEEEARSKCIAAQDTSNVDAANDKRIRKRPARYDHSDSDSSTGCDISTADNDITDKFSRKVNWKLQRIVNTSSRRMPLLSLSASKNIRNSDVVRSKPVPPNCLTASVVQHASKETTELDSSGSLGDDVLVQPLSVVNQRYLSPETDADIQPLADLDATKTFGFTEGSGEGDFSQPSFPPCSMSSESTATTPKTCMTSSSIREGSGIIGKLLLKVLSNMEEIRQMQKQHSHMLQALLKRSSVHLESGVPDGITLPMETCADVDNNEEKMKDSATRAAVVAVLAEIGGNGSTDFVKRCMRFVMNNDLAKQFNLTGQRGKRAFQPLLMFQAVWAAAKQNLSTKNCNRKDIEEGLQNWFSNARDRGSGGRKQKNSENRTPFQASQTQ